MYDYLIVGCGFAGATLAERISTVLEKRVCLVEKRDHIGGNASDYYNGEGILVHRYGPHIFHTDDEEIFSYLSRFTGWRFYEHRVLASVEGFLLPIPINIDTVNRLYGLDLDGEGLERYFESVREKIDVPKNAREKITFQVGADLYEKFFKNYTTKMWGLPPEELSPEVTGRPFVRTNRDDRYFTDRYQYMPEGGYTALFERMLESDRIELRLGTDFRDARGKLRAKRIIYTGPLDEYFDFRLGKLPYRSLEFKFETLHYEQHQPVAVVNYPNDHDYTRITEYKHLTGQAHPKTAISYEFPMEAGEQYYPILTGDNKELCLKYRELAENEEGVFFVGRLAEYRYYTMTDVIRNALDLFEKLVAMEGTGRL
jgi:UDP-galactopyranose mutase